MRALHGAVARLRAGFVVVLVAVVLSAAAIIATSAYSSGTVRCGSPLDVVGLREARDQLRSLDGLPEPPRGRPERPSAEDHAGIGALVERAERYDACIGGAATRLAVAGAAMVAVSLAAIAQSIRRQRLAGPGTRAVDTLVGRPGAIFVAIGLGAFAVRAAYAMTVTRFRDLGFDATYYTLLGQALADGRGFVDPFALYFGNELKPTALFPPGYPLVLGLASLVGADTRLWHLILSGVLGAVAAALIGVLGSRFFDRSVGTTAGVLAAVHPLLIGADAALMAESLYLLLVVIALLLVVRAQREPRVLVWALLGVVIGAAALTRGEGLGLLLALAVPAAALSRSGCWRSFAIRVAVCGLVTAALLVPWVLRNVHTFGEPVLLANNSSTVLAGANCPTTYAGERVGFWDFTCLRADRPGSRTLDETELNNLIRQDGARFLRDNVNELPRVMAIRLLRTWGLWHPLRQADFESSEGRSPGFQKTGWAVHAVLLPLAVVGLRVHRSRARQLWPLLAMVALVSVTSMLTYGNQRFRIAAEPTIVVLAAAGLAAVVRLAQEASRRVTSRHRPDTADAD